MAQEDRTTGLVGYSGVKVPVRVATTAAITLSGEQTIDGIACVTDDRVLVKNQASSVNNGIYVVDTGTWSRSADCDGSYDLVSGSLVAVVSGSTNAATMWQLTTTGTITIGTSALTWAQALFSSLSGVTFLQSGTGATSRAAQDKMREWMSVKDFGAVGDGATNDRDAINAAATAAANRILFFPAGTYLMNSAVTFAANVTCFFEKGAILSVPTGVTVTFTGQIQAGEQQIFTTAGTGKFVFGTAREVNAGWWPTYTTDAGPCITSAFASIAAVGGEVVLPGVAATLSTCANMTNLTGYHFGLRGVAKQSFITANVATLALDCTGSNNISFRDFILHGGTGTIPKAGIYLARAVTASDGIRHRFENVTFGGSFSAAPLFVYGSEELHFSRVYFQNAVNTGQALWVTSDNNGSGEDVTSVYTTIVTTTESTSEMRFFGCTFHVTGTGNTDCMRLRGVRDMQFDGTFFVNVNGRSCVYVDNSTATIESSFVVFNGFRIEPNSGTNVPYGWYFAGTTTCTDWTIGPGYVNVSTKGLYAVDNSKIQYLKWEQATAAGIDVYNLDYAWIRDNTAIAVRGTLFDSFVSGESADISITISNTASLIHYTDTGALNPAAGLFINRGDPAAADVTAFTTDGTWRDLDLSAFAPAGAKTLALHVAVTDDAADSDFWLRRKGNANQIAVSRINTQVVNIPVYADVIVPCNSSRVIQYMGDNLTFSAIAITVKGWWY